MTLPVLLLLAWRWFKSRDWPLVWRQNRGLVLLAAAGLLLPLLNGVLIRIKAAFGA